MTVTAEIAPLAVETAALHVVEFDMYRDIHKGIRAGLFAATAGVGSVDPGDREGVGAEAQRVRDLVELLVAHAEHEDDFVQPLVESHAPWLAATIVSDHQRLECQMAQLEVLADRAAGAANADCRGLVHRLYLGLASFTSDYLAHQAFEELEVNPALSAAMGVDELLAVNAAIVASIPPDMMAQSLSLMLPAMNVEDRVELLGGMQAEAPPEVFAGVLGLASQVLDPAVYQATAERLAVA